MGTASLIFGAASLLVGLCTCGLYGWLAMILAVLGIAFGAVGMKENRQHSMCIAGLVILTLALILGMILWFWIYPMVRSIGIAG